MTRQFSIFDPITTDYTVQLIDSKETYDYLRNIHYAHRIPSISYAYGLFKDAEVVGVVTYGTPASSTLCRGICGDDWQKYVLELNRLVLKNNLPNEASRLVAASLRLLPKPRIIVSFADTAQNHLGIVYQATNFIYTGLSAKFRDVKVRGLEHQHHATYGHGLSYKEIKEKYGEHNVYFVDRSRKHRYITFIGNRKEKQVMRSALKYEVLPYPTRTE
jgi:hypothetical protein